MIMSEIAARTGERLSLPVFMIVLSLADSISRPHSRSLLVGLPEKWFWANFTFPTSALSRHLSLQGAATLRGTIQAVAHFACFVCTESSKTTLPWQQRYCSCFVSDGYSLQVEFAFGK